MHRYDGNATYLNATSNTVNVNVTKMSTALTLTASNRTPVVNQQVTFNATLSSGTTLSQERSLSVVPSSLFLFRFQGPERIECCLSLPVSNRSLYYPLTFFRPTNVRVMRVYKTVSFSVVILLIAVLFAGVATVPAAAQYDTMQFRYSAQHTGDYSPVAGSVQPNIQLKWTYTTSGAVESSPAIANGVVYVGSDDGNIYALNATTGKQTWSFATRNNVYSSPSSPAIANGVVYVGSEDRNVYALNATSGAKLWNYTTGDPVLSSPAVVNGMVYVGSEDNNVYALNATTGVFVWSFTTRSAVVSSPAVANSTVYVGSNDNNVYALSATTGAQLWNYTTRSAEVSSPAVANGTVYVGSEDNNVYALNATTGAKLWNYTTGAEVYSSPAVANGTVYV
ncbi:MAG: PQQ-binding-like beta-propeller repeat protein, partial [Halobacteriota archaeon]